MSAITYILTVLALVAVTNAELICPGYGFIRPQGPCVNECSAEKDTCGGGKKCCYTPQSPCGYRCLVGKDNKAKSGTCPSPQSEQNNQYWNICDAHFCDVDSDCSCKKKCCPGKCGSKVCISPEKNTKKV